MQVYLEALLKAKVHKALDKEAIMAEHKDGSPAKLLTGSASFCIGSMHISEATKYYRPIYRHAQGVPTPMHMWKVNHLSSDVQTFGRTAGSYTSLCDKFVQEPDQNTIFTLIAQSRNQ